MESIGAIDSSIEVARGLSAIVVGAGKMGVLHGALLTAAGVDVVGMVDPNRLARLVVRGTGIRAATFCSLEAATRAHPAARACFVCTPPSSHFAVARQALEAGMHVFVEKPLSVRSHDSGTLAEMCRQRGVSGTVGYVRRHSPVYRDLKRRLQSFGNLTSIRIQILSPQFAHASEDMLQRRGGLEWDLVPHAADMLFWLVGTTGDLLIDRVERRGSAAILVVGTLGGTPFQVEADWSRSDVRKVELTATVTAVGRAELSAREDMVWEIGGDGGRRVLFHEREAPPPWFDVAGGQFSFQTADVLSAMRGGPSIAATFAEATRVDAFVEECVGR